MTKVSFECGCGVLGDITTLRANRTDANLVCSCGVVYEIKGGVVTGPNGIMALCFDFILETKGG